MTRDALDHMSKLCQDRALADGSQEIMHELPDILHAIKQPSVAAGMLKWLSFTLTEPDYIKLHAEPVPMHLVLLDEIATNHQLLHLK